MRFIGRWPSKDKPVDMTKERQSALDFLRTRGTHRIPDPPRDLIAQSGPRGVLLTWNNPQVFFDIVGWRVYKTDENTLYTEIRDRGNRQCFVESTAATTSPTSNFFVSSMNALGVESQKIQIQKAALNEAGAPGMPGSPAGFSTYSGDSSSTPGKVSGSNRYNLT